MHKISLLHPLIYDRDADLDALLAPVKSAGIDGFDFSLYIYETREPYFFEKPMEDLYEFFRPIKEALARHGLAICQTHSPNPTFKLGNDEYNAYMLRAHKKCLDLTRFFDCDLMVVHPCKALAMTPAEQKAESVRFYTALIEDARRTGVTILLENMWARREPGTAIFESACGSAEESVDWIDTLNAIAGEERFAYCFDAGHAALCGKNMRDFLITLGPRVKALHIHDTDHISDTHTIPYAFCNYNGASLTDWQSMLEGLRTIGYTGGINFEAPKAFFTYPAPLHGALLDMFHAIAVYFSDEIGKKN